MALLVQYELSGRVKSVNEAQYHMNNYGDRGECYPSRPQAEADNNLREAHNSSYYTQPHSLIVKYSGNGGPVASESQITAPVEAAGPSMLNGPIKKQVQFSLDPEIVDKPVDVFIIRRCFRRDEPFRGLIRGKKQLGAWFERVCSLC